MVKGALVSTVKLQATYGGNAQYSLPLVDGDVPYFKFHSKINPDFATKHEVWIEQGLRREQGAQIISRKNECVPVFEFVRTGLWRYLGDARFDDISSALKLNKINSNPPREPVAVILKLRFCK